MNDEILLDQPELFRVTIQQSSVAMTMQDENHRLLMVNPAYCQLVGYDESELLGQDPLNFILARDSVCAVLTDREDALPGSNAVATEIANYRELVHRDGRRIPVRLEVTVAHGVDQRRLLCSTLIDLSAQQRAVEAVQKRYDLFLREVHHRIKNDIQGVVNLLELNCTRHPENREAYDRAVVQLQSVADLHGLQFTQGCELDPVTVIQSIARSTSDIFGRHFAVSKSDQADGPDPDLFIADSEAMSFALIINELMTNACKHSSDARDPFAQISVHQRHLELRISNYGSLPPGFDLQAHCIATSGLGLVNALAPEPGLTIRLTANDGLVTAHVRVAPPISKQATSAQ